MRKKILYVVTLSFVCVFVNAQTFVNTSAEDKNVVLEEFTGIHCVYCPDGHKRAQELKDAYPDDVVLINIHEGNYASPGTGEPDFRTLFGTAIKNQSSLSGYPAGTVNRNDYTSQSWDQNGGTSMSRNYWASAAALVFAEASYVNVAAQATINVTTRVLTVDVEAYYTGTGAASNNLNVALLQNNIPGPQTGGSTWNPSQILPNGDYNHMHMLRHFLTGQWGDVTTNTSLGSFYSNTFTYTIPADLNGVVYDIWNLEVVVFMAEGQQVIISGSDAMLTYIVEPGYSLVDIEATTNMTMPASYCDANITPQITVTNNDTITVDSFKVSYSLDGNTPVTLVYNTANLAPSSSTTIIFPPITLSSGSHDISYNVSTDGTMLIDNIPGNNNVSSGTIIIISSIAFATSHTEGFESYSVTDNDINNAILINSNNENTYVVDNGVSGSVTWPLGAYGNSDKAWRMRFSSWNAGNEATLIFENIDFSNSTGNGMSFSYAYAQDTNEEDTLQILVSTDCGATWDLDFDSWGSGLKTSGPISGENFYPQATQWKTIIRDFSAYDGESTVMIAFKGICDGGNNLYFDDIEISNNVDISNPTSAIDEANSNLFVFKSYPNPINDLGVLELSLKRSAEVTVLIYDLLGQMVSPVVSGNFKSGTHRFEIETANLENGIYLVKVQVDGQIQSSKIIISD